MANTYDVEVFDLAESFLMDHPFLSSKSADELAKVIQGAIDDWTVSAEGNYDPTPYCSHGHRDAKSCDCGPIAANE